MSADGIASFRQRFGSTPDVACLSPGRINLIGEHTDYNGGWVLPIAIDLGNRFVVGRNGERRIRIHSDTYSEAVELSLDEIGALAPEGHWKDYFAGVLCEFEPFADTSVGLDVLIESTLPSGCGLSSSASITTGFATVLNELWGAGQTREQLVRTAQRAENRYVGLACGILDPFAVAMGQAGHAIALCCASMEWEAVPFPSDDYAVVAAATGVERRLAESDYNRRRDECEHALALVREDLPAETLSDLSPDELAAARRLSSDDVAYRRAHHVVTENRRVRSAVAALKAGDMTAFGAELLASHVSLRDDYEVSCTELDIMVDEAMRLEGVVGAKMTGAGFGGSVVAVVRSDAAGDVVERLERRYRSRCSHRPQFHVCSPADGVRVHPLG